MPIDLSQIAEFYTKLLTTPFSTTQNQQPPIQQYQRIGDYVHDEGGYESHHGGKIIGKGCFKYKKNY